MPFAQVRAMPDLADCASALAAPAGHAECALPRGPDNLVRVQLDCGYPLLALVTRREYQDAGWRAGDAVQARLRTEDVRFIPEA